jgi:hypothetical protein
MGEGGGIFSGIGEVIEKVKSPPDLFLITGVALFGWGVFKGPFSIENLMIEWGMVLALAGMGWKMLGDSVQSISDAYHDYRYIRWGKLIGGSLFCVGCSVMTFHLFMHRWPLQKLRAWFSRL